MMTGTGQSPAIVGAPTAGNEPLLGSQVQWGYVVKDIEAAMRHWTEVLHIGPFILIGGMPNVEFWYRGERTNLVLRNSFTYWGDTQIEFIQQINDEPSPYHDFITSGGNGLHHLGFWAVDFEERVAELERGGYEAVYKARLQGAAHPSVYFEGPQMGALLELSPQTDQKVAMYGAMEKLTREWDGTTDPIRRYDTMEDFAKAHDVPSWSIVN